MLKSMMHNPENKHKALTESFLCSDSADFLFSLLVCFVLFFFLDVCMKGPVSFFSCTWFPPIDWCFTAESVGVKAELKESSSATSHSDCPGMVLQLEWKFVQFETASFIVLYRQLLFPTPLCPGRSLCKRITTQHEEMNTVCSWKHSVQTVVTVSPPSKSQFPLPAVRLAFYDGTKCWFVEIWSS